MWYNLPEVLPRVIGERKRVRCVWEVFIHHSLEALHPILNQTAAAFFQCQGEAGRSHETRHKLRWEGESPPSRAQPENRRRVESPWNAHVKGNLRTQQHCDIYQECPRSQDSIIPQRYYWPGQIWRGAPHSMVPKLQFCPLHPRIFQWQAELDAAILQLGAALPVQHPPVHRQWLEGKLIVIIATAQDAEEHLHPSGWPQHDYDWAWRAGDQRRPVFSIPFRGEHLRHQRVHPVHGDRGLHQGRYHQLHVLALQAKSQWN